MIGHGRHVSYVGGMSFPDPHFVATAAIFREQQKRRRGKDKPKPGSAKRKKRCRLCRDCGTEREKANARECPGKKYAKLCTIFNEDESRK